MSQISPVTISVIDRAIMAELERQQRAGVKYLASLNVDDLVAAVSASLQPATPTADPTKALAAISNLMQRADTPNVAQCEQQPAWHDAMADRVLQLKSAGANHLSCDAVLGLIAFVRDGDGSSISSTDREDDTDHIDWDTIAEERLGQRPRSEHGRHIPQTSPAPGCDSGSLSVTSPDRTDTRPLRQGEKK